MKNALEFSALGLVGEDQLPHPRTVKQAFTIEYFAAKRVANLGKARRALCYDFTRNHVGIDDRYTEIIEKPGNERLAAGYAASEAEPEWSARGGIVDGSVPRTVNSCNPDNRR